MRSPKSPAKSRLGKGVPSADKPKALREWATQMQDPTVMNAMTAMTYVMGAPDTVRWEAAIQVLENCAQGVRSGDLSGVEGLLVSQAMALNAIFTKMAWRAQAEGRFPTTMETYLHLALKAQNQSRMTLETLAAIKTPPVVFSQQTNIAHGPQQVNNGAAPGIVTGPARAKCAQSKLLDASNGKRLDAGAAGTAGGADPHLEAVGAVHGAAHR